MVTELRYGFQQDEQLVSKSPIQACGFLQSKGGADDAVEATGSSAGGGVGE
jgi:hypothetical protein